MSVPEPALDDMIAELRGLLRDHRADPKNIRRRQLRTAMAQVLRRRGESFAAAEQDELAGNVWTRYVIRRVGRVGEAIDRLWFDSRSYTKSWLTTNRVAKDGEIQVRLDSQRFGTQVFGPYAHELSDHVGYTELHGTNYGKIRPDTFVRLDELEVVLHTLTPHVAGVSGAEAFVKPSPYPLLGAVALDLTGATDLTERPVPKEKATCSKKACRSAAT